MRLIHECLWNLLVAKVGFSTYLFAFEYDTADIYSIVPLTLLGSSVSWSGMQSPGNAVLFFSTTAVTLFSLLSSTEVPVKTNWLCSVYYSVFIIYPINYFFLVCYLNTIIMVLVSFYVIVYMDIHVHVNLKCSRYVFFFCFINRNIKIWKYCAVFYPTRSEISRQFWIKKQNNRPN